MSDSEHRISGFPSGNDPEQRLALFLAADAIKAGKPERPAGNLWSLNFLTYENRMATRWAPLLFAIFVALQLFALLAFIRYFFRPTWDQHVAAGPLAMVVTVLICNVVTCFGEYLFHRYLLHLDIIKFLRGLCISHRTHHKLTSIGFDERSGTVRSAYEISDVEHDDQSTFPPWALLAFFAFWTPFLAVIAFSFPGVPILIGGYTALAIAHFLYEFIHSLHHESYETFWKPRLQGRLLSPAWTWLYGFHQAHHANYHCNLNVAGFYGIPVADLVFGTYKTPEPLLVDGAPATKAAARNLVPAPHWPISWLDRLALKRRRRMGW